MASIVKKSQRLNERAGRAEGIVRLLLIILWAVLVLGMMLWLMLSGIVHINH